MHLGATVFILLLILKTFSAAASEAIGYSFELDRKEFVSIHSLRFKDVKVNAKRISNLPILQNLLKVNVYYIDKDQNILGEENYRFNLRNCERAKLNQKCSELKLSLNWALNPFACKLKFKFENQIREINWGQCKSYDVGFVPDLTVNLLEESSDGLSFEIQNKGSKPSSEFRILLEYLDHKGDLLTYAFESINKVIFSGNSIVLNFPHSYLEWFSCKVKITLDPDGVSQTLPKNQLAQIFNYGECSGDLFIPQGELKISKAIKDLETNTQVIFLATIKNSGDLPLQSREADVFFEGRSKDGRVLFNSKGTLNSSLSPNESFDFKFSLNRNLLSKICYLDFTLQTTDSNLDLNLNNNIKTINLCTEAGEK